MIASVLSLFTAPLLRFVIFVVLPPGFSVTVVLLLSSYSTARSALPVASRSWRTFTASVSSTPSATLEIVLPMASKPPVANTVPPKMGSSLIWKVTSAASSTFS